MQFMLLLPVLPHAGGGQSRVSPAETRVSPSASRVKALVRGVGGTGGSSAVRKQTPAPRLARAG